MSVNKINIFNTCSIGTRCISSQILENLKIKKESYPFDWIFSNLDIIKHCIQDDFKIFLDKQYYFIINKNTRLKEEENFHNNYLLYKKSISYNKFFLKDVKVNLSHTYYSSNKNSIFVHRNPLLQKDYNYYERCVSRFKYLLKDNLNKLFIYYDHRKLNEESKQFMIDFNDFLKIK